MRLKTLLILMCLAISLIPISIIGGIYGFYSTLTIMLIGLIAVVVLIVTLILAYFISKPIEKLTKNIDEISKGNLNVKLENTEIFEVNKLIDSLNRVMASLKLAINKVGVKKGEIFEETVKAKESVEEKYESLLENINGWMWEIDTKGRYTYCSDKISDIIGYSPEKIVGKSFFNFISPEDVKNVKQVFDEACKKQEPIKQLENWIVSKNSEKKCFVTNAYPFFDNSGNLIGFRGVDIDITENKKSMDKLDQLNSELESLRKRLTYLLNERDRKKSKKKDKKKLFNAHERIEEKWSDYSEYDSVFIFDEQANILDCNENMHKRLGYTKGEMLSLNMADFDALESREDITKKIDELKKTGSIIFKTIHKRKDGSAILVHENLLYLKDKNMFKCIVKEE